MSAAGALAGKVALVTGASRGIGAATALALASAGAHVVATARTLGGLEALDDRIRQETGRGATLLPLDLVKFDEVDKLGPALAERFGRLDVLVAAAGILGTLSPTGHYDATTVDRVFAVNTMASWRLIRTLDPLLRAADRGVGVFLTDRGVAAEPFWGIYRASKAALEAMVESYAAEVRASALRIVLFDPGPTRGALRRKAFPGELDDAMPHPDVAGTRIRDLVIGG